MTDPDEHGFELAMPFVAVRSAGGPFDDAAYAAGWEMGALDALADLSDAMLGGPTKGMTMPLHAENRAQADLIAMRHGWTATFTEHPERPEWLSVDLHRPADDEKQW